MATKISSSARREEEYFTFPGVAGQTGPERSSQHLSMVVKFATLDFTKHLFNLQ